VDQPVQIALNFQAILKTTYNEKQLHIISIRISVIFDYFLVNYADDMKLFVPSVVFSGLYENSVKSESEWCKRNSLFLNVDLVSSINDLRVIMDE
jgi:hypothetical protein